jgi:hypothetical protein
MSDAIRFLESMGSDSSLSRLSADEYAATVASLEVGPLQQRALIDRDHAALSDLLGGRATLLCSVFAPDEEEEKEGDVPDGEVPDELE